MEEVGICNCPGMNFFSGSRKITARKTCFIVHVNTCQPPKCVNLPFLSVLWVCGKLCSKNRTFYHRSVMSVCHRASLRQWPAVGSGLSDAQQLPLRSFLGMSVAWWEIQVACPLSPVRRPEHGHVPRGLNRPSHENFGPFVKSVLFFFRAAARLSETSVWIQPDSVSL